MITVNPKTRLNSQIDDDWEIRKTYRTNMPMEYLLVYLDCIITKEGN